MTGLTEFLARGGPALWVIAALSVATLALILWKLQHLVRMGAWSRVPVRRTADAAARGDAAAAEAALAGRDSARARVARTALTLALGNAPPDRAREEMFRVARAELAQAARANRALDLIATLAPLVGLLGTVLGMIEAFQALQAAGQATDAAALAGGIWEALLTTAAGMAVAIPASAALAWFEGVSDRMAQDMEDAGLRILNGLAAERS